MNANELKHKDLSVPRLKAYINLFGCRPSAVFPYHTFTPGPDELFLIDAVIFTLTTQSGEVAVAATNGMSDHRMVEPDHTQKWSRRELLQYLPECTPGHARQLHDMAWLPLFDGFLVDTHHSVAWKFPAVEGTPWKNAFFLLPLIRSHREIQFEVEGERASFLWHIPISEEEREYNMKYGSDALIDRMEAVNLPWVFDEKNRPPLV